MPSHHWFHYTDVPVEAAKYSAGKTGRSQWDIVHMITYCVAVLRGEIPEENPRKITKAVAIMLLAHYVGDIHQPLHVGAQYFDQSGHKVNPDLGKPALEDQGGNTISLQVSGGNSDKPKKLHSFWDGDPVTALFPGGMAELEKDERKEQMGAAEKKIVHDFAVQEPKGWRPPANLALKDYAEAWADEILPIAREAHDRLSFQEMTTKVQDDGATIATGVGKEKADAGSHFLPRLVRDDRARRVAQSGLASRGSSRKSGDVRRRSKRNNAGSRSLRGRKHFAEPRHPFGSESVAGSQRAGQFPLWRLPRRVQANRD